MTLVLIGSLALFQRIEILFRGHLGRYIYLDLLKLCVNFVPKITQKKPTKRQKLYIYLEDPGMFHSLFLVLYTRPFRNPVFLWGKISNPKKRGQCSNTTLRILTPPMETPDPPIVTPLELPKQVST